MSNFPAPSPFAAAWPLDPAVVMLNHGSFGACPRVVLDRQQALRERIESEPVRFFMREIESLLDASRETLAGLLVASTDDLVFVRNATSGVNGVLRSLRFEAGDEILMTDHEYNACANTVRWVAERTGARAVLAQVPVPVVSSDEIVERIMERVTDRTRLALLDHITSPTAVVMPIERLIARLAERGIDTLVDGAHGPGMLRLELERLGAAYYTGNCHKWLCAPKGAAFLHVRRDRQRELHPTVISHGLNSRRPGHSRFQDEFDWTGTDDPTPWLCVGDSIRFLESFEGGLAGVMRRNAALAREARELLCSRWGAAPICPVEMLGSMAAMALPPSPGKSEPQTANETGSAFAIHPLQTALFERFGVEVPVFFWGNPPQLILRVSAQLYNSRAQYEYLAEALGILLREKHEKTP
ncbi:MAG TPA: aminotransferase class V-fold PLP-dependent enzyme [Thermoguttaceae bacterium]|nr:aminotransferase class V-fold PLP-dependent enzyme [Thermoguttaceae bacterium]